MNAPTAPANSSKSACPSSTTGEFQARQTNQLATMIPSATSPKSPFGFCFFQKLGTVAASEIPKASMAGPHVHGRICGPMSTARAKLATRKMAEIAGTR